MVALQIKGKEQTDRNFLKKQAQTWNQKLEQLTKLRLNTERRAHG